MLFWIIIGLYLLSVVLTTNWATVYDLSKKKGYENKYYRNMSMIPIYGYNKIKALETLSHITKEEVDHLMSVSMILKRFGFFMLLNFLITLLIIPIAVLLYLGAGNWSLSKLLLIYMAIVLILFHQGIVVEYARKKGYEGIKIALYGLIPIISFIHVVKLPKKRNISKAGLRAIFSFGNIIGRLVIMMEIVLLTIVVIVPVVYIFGMAFANLQSAIPNTIWPSQPSFEAFTHLFQETNFLRWYWNTLLIALINMVVGTLLITGASYVFARFSFKGKKAGLLTILVLQAFPSFMGLIAMYVLFWKFGLLGKPTALTILYIGGSIPGNLWLVKGFLGQIPKDLDESAMIDGANKLQIFFKVLLPLAIPILTFVAVNMFMAPWMDYMLPGYLLQFKPTGLDPAAAADYDITQQWTLAVGIFDFIEPTSENLHYSAFAAAVIFVGFPITILYMTFQKYLIEGIMAGATKG